MKEKEPKFMTLSQSDNVKVQLSDETIYTWAYKNATLHNTTTQELYQEFMDKYKDKDGYINAPLSAVMEMGKNIRGDILINKMENEKSKFMALSQSSKVKAKISDEVIHTWAYKNATLHNTTAQELYQKFMDQYKEKDGYINAPFYKLMEMGRKITSDILINENDLHEPQTKSPEPEREM